MSSAWDWAEWCHQHATDSKREELWDSLLLKILAPTHSHHFSFGCVKRGILNCLWIVFNMFLNKNKGWTLITMTTLQACLASWAVGGQVERWARLVKLTQFTREMTPNTLVTITTLNSSPWIWDSICTPPPLPLPSKDVLHNRVGLTLGERVLFLPGGLFANHWQNVISA